MNQINWLKQTLGATFPDHEFADLEVKRIGEAYGFASQIYRVGWRHDVQTRSVVAKIWPLEDDSSLAELRFFQSAAKLDIRIPKYFYGAADHERQQVILLLEDVADVIQGDYLKLPTHPQVKALLASLARWHAHTVDHPLLKSEWIIDFSEWQPDTDWIKSRRAEFLERFPHQLNPQALNLLNQLESAPAVAHSLGHHAPCCLLHGDFHLDNILFESDDRPVFLDWSHPAKGSPAYNLVQQLIFMGSVDRFSSAVSTYLSVFNAHASNPITEADLARWLDAEFLRTFATATCSTARWRPKGKRGKQIIQGNLQMINAAAAFWEPRLKNIGIL